MARAKLELPDSLPPEEPPQLRIKPVSDFLLVELEDPVQNGLWMPAEVKTDAAEFGRVIAAGDGLLPNGTLWPMPKVGERVLLQFGAGTPVKLPGGVVVKFVPARDLFAVVIT